MYLKDLKTKIFVMNKQKKTYESVVVSQQYR